MIRVLTTATTLLLIVGVFPGGVRSAETPDAVDGGKAFSCRGRPAGYYADLQTGCQRYHMCDVGGRRYSYACPNQTLFQQRVMVCDHWFMVDCALSESFFGANELLGQPGRRFVDNDDAFFVKTARRAHGRRPVDRTSAAYLASVASPRPPTPTPTPTPRRASEGKASPVKLAATLSPAYAGNPFFRSLTAAPTPGQGRPGVPAPTASRRDDVFNVVVLTTRPTTATSTATTPPSGAQQLRTRSPEAAVTTTPTPTPTSDRNAATRQGQSGQSAFWEVTAARREQASWSTPTPTPTPTPTSDRNAATRQGQSGQSAFWEVTAARREQVSWPTPTPPPTPTAGELYEAARADEAALSDNTVELRFPDPRRMFFIPDSAARETEMLRAANETVLRIELSAPAQPHGAAMRFKAARGTGRNARGPWADCPQCHPAFLFPGTCTPCVLIR